MSGLSELSSPSRRGRRLRTLCGAWLVLSLLGQGLLPVQAHSRWQIDERGRLVELCTLQGTQLVHVDPESGMPVPAQSDTDTSPAMVFSLLLGHAAPAVPPGLGVPPAEPVRGDAAPAPRAPIAPEARRRPIRGPPAS